MVKSNKYLSKIILYCALGVLLIFALFPIYWMINTSLKSQTEIYSVIPTYWPKFPTLRGYYELIKETNFLVQLKNSILVSTIVSAASLFVSVLAAYSIARMQLPMKTGISRAIIYSYLMPRTIMYIPLYMFVTMIGINNSKIALYVVYPTIVIPYATWMLISYFKSIPYELEEAAIVDGCGRLRAMFNIIVPLAKPGIVATFIFSFTLCWNEFLYALVMVNKSIEKTIPVGLSELIVDDLFAWGQLMAGAVIATIPIVILYMSVSKYLVSGLSAGAVKG